MSTATAPNAGYISRPRLMEILGLTPYQFHRAGLPKFSRYVGGVQHWTAKQVAKIVANRSAPAPRMIAPSIASNNLAPIIRPSSPPAQQPAPSRPTPTPAAPPTPPTTSKPVATAGAPEPKRNYAGVIGDGMGLDRFTDAIVLPGQTLGKHAERNAAMAAKGYVRGGAFAQRLGWSYPKFASAVGTLIPTADITDNGGNSFWKESTVAAIVQRHISGPKESSK